MNTKDRNKVLKALRGESPQGVYAQCRESLVKVDENGDDLFCVLGVIVNELGTDAEIKDHLGSNGDSPCAFASTDFRRRIGLVERIPDSTLMYMNDREKKSFAEIADYIEKVKL